MSFSAFAIVGAAATIGSEGGDFESASAAASLSASGPGPGGSGSQFSSDIRFVSISFPGSTATADLVNVSFANLTGSDMVGEMSREASANGSGFSSVVPEPETYALMLAGLGLLAFMVRRRARQA